MGGQGKFFRRFWAAEIDIQDHRETEVGGGRWVSLSGALLSGTCRWIYKIYCFLEFVYIKQYISDHNTDKERGGGGVGGVG